MRAPRGSSAVAGCVLGVALCVPLFPSSAVAQAPLPDRIFIVWTPGLTPADLLRPGTEALATASVASVSSRTARAPAWDTSLHAVTFGEGERVETGAGPTLLGRAVEATGYSTLAIVRPGAPTVTAQQIFGRPTPMVAATDLDAIGAVPARTAVVIDVGGDGALLGAGVIEAATPQDLVIVAGVVPPAARLDDHIRLGVVAISGPGFPKGVLSSPTTRRRGLIALVDIAPTIVRAVGRSFDAEGRPVEVHAVPHPRRAVLELDHELIEQRAARTPVTRTALYASMALAIAVAMLGTRGGRAVRALGAGVLTLPIAGFISTALPGPALPVTIGIGALAALVAMTFGPKHVAAAVALATAAIPLIDLLLGSPIGHRSPWGVLLSGGGRFYGVSEDSLGLIGGGAIVAAALLARTRAAIVVAVALFALATAISAAPGLGAKFGAAPTLVPAFGVFAVLAAGRRIGVKAIAAIALATVLATGGSVLADRLRPERGRSHVARAIEGDVDIGSLLARKVEATAKITGTSAWTPGALAAGAGLYLLARRRRVGEGFYPAMGAAATGAVAALVVNDGGIVTAAAVLVIVHAGTVAAGTRSPAGRVEG